MSVCVCSLKMKYGDSRLEQCVNVSGMNVDNEMSFEVLISLSNIEYWRKKQCLRFLKFF